MLEASRDSRYSGTKGYRGIRGLLRGVGSLGVSVCFRGVKGLHLT